MRNFILALICAVLTPALQAATLDYPADYPTVQDAIIAASPGDEIVISTNGPINEFIAIVGGMAANLTIRAALGFAPVIEGKAGMQFTPSGTPPTAAIQEGVLVYIEKGSTWIGIRFRIDMAGLDDLFGAAGEKYHCKVAGTSGGGVSFTNCTWEWANNPNDPDTLNSHMLRLESGAALNPINFDHCQWRYISMTPTNLGGRLTGAFTDSVGLVNDVNFVDCSWDISPDTGGFRRHGVGVLNSTPSTLRFLRCTFGDVNTNDPATDPRQGQAWCNLPHRQTYFDQCKFGRGAGRTIATAIPGNQYVNQCLFLPTRGNLTLNDPIFGGNQIDTFFTNCVFLYRSTQSGNPINADDGPGTEGRGNFRFVHCTAADLDGTSGQAGFGFAVTRSTTSGFMEIDNSLFSIPSLGGATGGIIRNNDTTGATTVGGVIVRGKNMLLADSSYNLANDTIKHASDGIPILADPLLQADSIHLSDASPAIDAGGELGVLTDFDRNARPTGPRPDIGADEAPLTVVVLTITPSGANAIISWQGGGTLQISTNAAGPYTDIPGATSPRGVVPTGPEKYYRVRK